MQRASHTGILVTALVIGVASTCAATMVQRMSLARVARDAASIVHATVAEVHSGRDESGLPSTWVTLGVNNAFKGAPPHKLTIKQYGVQERLADGTMTRVAGLPRYRVGDEVVLFLHGNSRRGFTSPVGFGQGVFRVDRTKQYPVVRSDLSGRSRDLDAFFADVVRFAGAAQ